jgi:hypothetical protein
MHILPISVRDLETPKEKFDERVLMEHERTEPINWTSFRRALINIDAQMMILAFGLIATFLPWYVRTFLGQPVSISLFEGLSNSSSLGLEMAGVFFYLGLAICALRKIRVSAAGLMLMMISVIIGWYSVADTGDGFGTAMNAGLGWYFGIVVVVLLAIVLFFRLTE